MPISVDAKAFMYQQGGKIISDLFRMIMTRPQKKTADNEYSKVAASPTAKVETKPVEEKRPDEVKEPPVSMTQMIGPGGIVKSAGTPTEDELMYRYECCTKHLGAASILLKEAYERAIGDDGIGPGTAEKVMAALNEHAAMEDDIMPMLQDKSVVGEEAKKLLDATRKFRRAAWDCRITVGKGTVDDVDAARQWNDILLQTTYANAQKYPGELCVKEGM